MEEETQEGFIYAFNVAAQNPTFAMLPEGQQFTVEKRIVDVIFESFVVPADHDYLTARTMAIGGLERAFFWSAGQAIEKYIKAFLLLHGVSILDLSKGHQLNPLLNAAKEVEADFDKIELALHSDLVLPPEFKLKSFTLTTFIADVEKLGSGANRYNKNGADFSTGHLFALDSLAYQLRARMGIPSFDRSFRTGMSSDFNRYLYDNNPYYAPADFVHTKLPSPAFPLRRSMTATTWDYLIKNKPSGFPMIEGWLKSKMKI